MQGDIGDFKIGFYLHDSGLDDTLFGSVIF